MSEMGWLHSPIVVRLSLALVHFLWQGALLGILALIVSVITRRAAVRYGAFLVILAVMAACPVVTFLTLADPSAADTPVGRPALGNDVAGSSTFAASGTGDASAETRVAAAVPLPDDASSVRRSAGGGRARAAAILGQIETRLGWVAVVWVGGVLALSLRLLVGWARLSGSRKRAALLDAERWRELVARLSHELRLRRPVRLLAASAAWAPVAMGWLRPVILLPSCALAGLTPEHLELVVAHELAHIRRGDCLVVLIQTVIETVLFYHPAVWWLSRRLREEREHCCDDLVVAVCGDAVTYARALSELQRMREGSPQLAVAASGGPLLARIRRLIGLSDGTSLRLSSWVAGVLAVALVSCLGLAARVLGQTSGVTDRMADMRLATAAPGNTGEIIQWLPSESHPGGTQYDARLDTTVTFWRAGVTLDEVFQDIRQQTGVTLTFYPENDENRRVRVNLFLNQSEPPTLRALMAQLTWVVDCPFFISDVGGQIVYSLASTSIGAGAEQAILAQREANLQRREQHWTSMDEKLDECRQALLLSRGELIRRYRGKDDFLLLNLLDPARRAAAQFVCRHLTQTRPPGSEATHDVDELSWGRGVTAHEFTPEDLVDLRAVRGALPAWVTIQVSSSTRTGEASLSMQLPKPVTTGPDGKPTRGPESLRDRLSTPPPVVIVSLPSPVLLAGEEEVQLRRSLGEKITPEQEGEFVRQHDAELQAAALQRKQREQDTRRALSPGAKERLASVALPVTTSGHYRRWQLFEALASVSGYHVVCDAFQNDGVALSLTNRGKKNEWPRPVMPYLDALTVTRGPGPFRRPMWQWGDAGTFLRFRSTNRDIYRAALMPEDFLHWVDGLVYPYLPEEKGTRSVAFALAIDLPEWTRQLGRLTSMQLRYGDSVSQAPPDDLAGTVRKKVLQSVLRGLDPGLLPHFLGTLSDAQWQRLRAEGLSGPADLSPGQTRLLAAWVSASAGPPVPSDYSRISIRIADTGDGSVANDQPGADRSDWRCEFEGTMWKLEKVRHGDEESEQETSGAHRGGSLPNQVTVNVELPIPAGRS